ncbi:uncharacterized protein LJ264_006054 isoform 1-T1 [Porphyrio hochstetteri]
MGNIFLPVPHTTEGNRIHCAGQVTYWGSDAAKNTGLCPADDCGRTKPGHRTRPRSPSRRVTPAAQRQTVMSPQTGNKGRGTGRTASACLPPLPQPGPRGRPKAGGGADSLLPPNGPGPPDSPRWRPPPERRLPSAERPELRGWKKQSGSPPDCVPRENLVGVACLEGMTGLKRSMACE